MNYEFVVRLEVGLRLGCLVCPPPAPG